MRGMVDFEDENNIVLPTGWHLDVLNLVLQRVLPDQLVEITVREIVHDRIDGRGYGLSLGEAQVAINQLVDATSVLRRNLSLIGQEQQ